MKTHSISNEDDVIDSRDVIARIEELQEEIAQAEGEDFDGSKVGGLDDPVDASDRDELAHLQALAEEASGYAADWEHGEQLIRETYFVEAMRELCVDIGDVPKNIPSYLEIDWEKTAENLKADYTEVDYDGVTYLIR